MTDPRLPPATTLPTRTTLAAGAQAYAREQGWPPYRPTCSACGGGTHVAVGERCSLCQPVVPGGGAGLEALAVELARFCSCAGGAYGDNTEPDEVRPYLDRAFARGVDASREAIREVVTGAAEATARLELERLYSASLSAQLNAAKGMPGGLLATLDRMVAKATETLTDERDQATARAEAAERALADAQADFACAETGLELQAQAHATRADQAEAALATLREHRERARQQWQELADQHCARAEAAEDKLATLRSTIDAASDALAAALEPTRG